jgi:hypothetical protein
MTVPKKFLLGIGVPLLCMIGSAGCQGGTGDAPSQTSTSGIPRTQADFDQQIAKAQASNLPADQKQKVIDSLTAQRNNAPVN